MINNVILSPFDSNIIFSINKINHIQEPIHPNEYAIIKGSIEKRRQEFIAGRVLAKKVLKKLNIHEFPLLSANNRAPIWPTDIVGSISHSNEYACVVATRKSIIKGIGIDIEETTKIELSELDLILTDYEKKWLSLECKKSQEIKSKIIFSMKESLYKCISPIINRFVDFKQVDIEQNESKDYQIVSISNVPEIDISHLKTGVMESNNHILTYVTYEY